MDFLDAHDSLHGHHLHTLHVQSFFVINTWEFYLRLFLYIYIYARAYLFGWLVFIFDWFQSVCLHLYDTICHDITRHNKVNAKFIDHRDFQRPCYVDWDRIMKKHFNQLPTQYMFNYFFEFDKGIMSMRSLSSAPNSSIVYVPLIKASSLNLIKRSILSDLFDINIITIE